MKTKFFFIAIATALTITACNQNEKAPDAPVEESPKTENTAPTNKVFDLATVPLSDKPLQAFPYISLPNGYVNASQDPVAEADSAYFWVVDHFERPAGKIFFSRVKAEEGKTYSEQEVFKGLNEAITSLGGVKISETKVPSDAAATINEANKIKYLRGYGFIGYAITSTYLIHRADKNIWIQITPTDDGVSFGWMVLEQMNH